MGQVHTVVLPRYFRKLHKPGFEGISDPDVLGFARKAAVVVPHKSGGTTYWNAFFYDGDKGNRFANISEEEAAILARFSGYRIRKASEYSTKKEIERLKAFLMARNVSLDIDDGGHIPIDDRANAIRIIRRTLGLIPEGHILTEKFSTLRIGGVTIAPGCDQSYGFGGGSYVDGIVHISGARLHSLERTLIATVLHELGHVFEEFISRADFDRLQRAFATIGKNLFVSEYFEQSAEERSRYLLLAGTSDLISENYMHYVILGDKLRDFVSSLSAETGEAWRAVMDVYARNFNGVKYTSDILRYFLRIAD